MGSRGGPVAGAPLYLLVAADVAAEAAVGTFRGLPLGARDIAVAAVAAEDHAAPAASWIAIGDSLASDRAVWTDVRRAVIDVDARVAAPRATFRAASAGVLALYRAGVLAFDAAVHGRVAVEGAGVTA